MKTKTRERKKLSVENVSLLILKELDVLRWTKVRNISNI